MTQNNEEIEIIETDDDASSIPLTDERGLPPVDEYPEPPEMAPPKEEETSSE